jgi:hypothetical protein
MKRLVRLIVRGDQPFTLVEDEDFRALLQLLKYDIAVPSASTIRREIDKVYGVEIARVADQLRHVDSKISLTLDCWTSPNTKAFLGITAHYIDDAWVSHSLVLDFVPLPGMHTGKELCETLVTACNQFGIMGSILGITTDNAANIDKLLEHFEDECCDRGVKFEEE